MAYAFGRNLLLNSVGFDRLIDAFQQFETGDPASRAQTYPPYNIVKQSENNYLVEVAVAGFKQEDIDITVEGNKLSISGKVQGSTQGDYLHKGIATRDFSHQFTLAETVVVRAADMLNGLLVVRLENVIPEEKLPRKILIGGTDKHVIEERLAA
jgi:molecular chaperone IbpA